MTKPANIEGIEKATGISWDEWIVFLDNIGAKELSHPEIAAKVYERIVESGVFDDTVANRQGRQNSSGWWSQGVTVAYEQHIGRRQPGQRSDGTYEVSVTKTIDGTMDDAMQWWLGKAEGMTEFSGVKLSGEPRSTSTPVARNWRIDLADGTKLLVSTSAKGKDKALMAVTTQKLGSSEDAEAWRAFWREFLAKEK